MNSNGYKWATWILLIVVIILIVMLAKKSDETVVDTFGDINDEIAECRANLAAWRQEHPVGATSTPDQAAEADEELQDIIEECMNAVEDAQGAIGTQEAGTPGAGQGGPAE